MKAGNKQLKQTCQGFSKQIDLLAAGWLSSRDNADLNKHLEMCPDCQKQLSAAKQIASLIGDSQAPSAPMVNAYAMPARDVSTIPRPAWVGLCAATCVALLGWLVLQRLPAGKETSPLESQSQSGIVELSESPPTFETYTRALSLSDTDLDRLLAAHARNVDFYEPNPMRLTGMKRLN